MIETAPALPARRSKRLAATLAIVFLTGGVTGAALAERSATPKLVGNASAGKALFVSKCGVCHQLKAAGTVGTIGGSLDKVKLTEGQIIQAITLGGAAVMTKAALAKFPTQMTGFKGTLTTTQINNIAAYEYTATHSPTAK